MLVVGSGTHHLQQLRGGGGVKDGSIKEVPRGADPASFVGQVVRIPTNRVKLLTGQPRQHFDKVQLERLRESIAAIGQQAPATVIPSVDDTFRLRDGERRWRCCIALGIPLTALVVEGKSTEEEFELSTAANMNRESHSPIEKALAMRRLRDGPLKRTVGQIAQTFGVTSTTVASHLLVVDQLPKAVIDLMDPNRMGGRKATLQLSIAVQLTAIAKYPNRVIQIANKCVREKLSMFAAKSLIDEFADRKGIDEGRGRSRTAVDILDLLTTSLTRAHLRLDHFADKTQWQIDDYFAFTKPERHGELLDQIDEIVNDLIDLRAKFAAVKNIGMKRKGAA